MTTDQTRARFRANLEVDGVPPFWEDQLYGQRGTTVRFSIGDFLFDGVNPCQRCVVPARDPITGQDNQDFCQPICRDAPKAPAAMGRRFAIQSLLQAGGQHKLVRNTAALSLSGRRSRADHRACW